MILFMNMKTGWIFKTKKKFKLKKIGQGLSMVLAFLEPAK